MEATADLDKKEKLRAYYREYRRKHRLAHPEYYENYRNKNRDKFRTYHKKYTDKNREALKQKRIANNTHRKATLRVYGLTIEKYDCLLKEQGGKCAICGRTDTGHKTRKVFNVDHDHKTGQVRGLLCHHCNVFLGHTEDSIDRLKQAIVYLEKSNANR